MRAHDAAWQPRPGNRPDGLARASAPHAFAALQRAAGNRAVAGLVAQRDFSGSETATSNEGQVLAPDAPRDSYRYVQEPASTPDPSRAKIDVHSVELSAVGYGHAFIVTTDDRGIRRYYRGGPDRHGTLGADDWGTIRSWYGPYVPGTIDWTIRPDHSVTVKSGPAALGFDNRLATEAENIEASRTPYHPTGPNSNTAVRELLARTGLPQRRPQLMLPGWGDTIPRVVSPPGPSGGGRTAQGPEGDGGEVLA